MNIAVVGACGKLGSEIVKILEENDTIFKVDLTLNNSIFDLSTIDCVIDSSTSINSIISASYCSKHNIPLLIACTGHTQEQLNIIDNLCKNISYAICPNLSAGMLWIMQSLTHLGILNNPFISITETHHKGKADTPSGTAIALKNQIKNYTNLTSAITSVRLGDTVGTHTINILLDGEEISVTHKVLSRKVFAIGAARAIKQLCSLPARKYSLIDLLGKDYEN